MGWLREHGLISKYEDYLDLPMSVLEDARLLMEGEAVAVKRERARAEQAARRTR